MENQVKEKYPMYSKSDLIGKENATFTIIAARPDREPAAWNAPCEIVLGYRRLTGEWEGVTADYVTWKYNQQTGSYFWGHYTGDFEAAVKDYFTR